MKVKNISKWCFILLGIITLFLILIPEKEANAATNYYITLGDGSYTESRKLGDVNLDGIYSSRDLDLLTKNLTSVSGYENLPGKMNGDFNDDFIVDLNDFNKENETTYTPKNTFIDYFIKTGTKFTLKLTKQGAYGSEDFNIENVTWRTSDENIATVNETTGEVEIIGYGTNGKGSIIALVDNTEVDRFNFSSVSRFIQGYGFRYPVGMSMEKAEFRFSKVEESRAIVLTTTRDRMKAVNVKMRIDIDSEPDIICTTNGWEITQKNYSNGLLNFIAEVSNLQNTNTKDTVDFKITYGSHATSRFGNDIIYFDEILTTNNDNYVINILENQRFVFPLEEKIITIKKDFEDRIQIKNGKMYVKLNGTNNGEKSYATTTDLANCLDIANRL